MDSPHRALSSFGAPLYICIKFHSNAVHLPFLFVPKTTTMSKLCLSIFLSTSSYLVDVPWMFHVPIRNVHFISVFYSIHPVPRLVSELLPFEIFFQMFECRSIAPTFNLKDQDLSRFTPLDMLLSQ